MVKRRERLQRFLDCNENSFSSLKTLKKILEEDLRGLRWDSEIIPWSPWEPWSSITPINCPYTSPSFQTAKIPVIFFAPWLQMIKYKLLTVLAYHRQKYVYSLKDEALLLEITFWRASAEMSHFHFKQWKSFHFYHWDWFYLLTV